MKVVIVSESPADEAAVRILVDGILGQQTVPITLSSLRAPGISGVLGVLPAAFKELHYHTDADALVVVVDANHSPVHESAHERPGGADGRCRLCKLRQVIAQVQGQLRPLSGRPAVKTALGIAVPAVEAWYQCGRDPHVTEAAWIVGLQSRSYPYTKNRLKQDVYGMERPPLALETRRAIEEAQRLVQDLTLLENLFPAGFGSLARDVRSW
jgi:hypothetical protein